MLQGLPCVLPILDAGQKPADLADGTDNLGLQMNVNLGMLFNQQTGVLKQGLNRVDFQRTLQPGQISPRSTSNP